MYCTVYTGAVLVQRCENGAQRGSMLCVSVSVNKRSSILDTYSCWASKKMVDSALSNHEWKQAQHAYSKQDAEQMLCVL